MDYKVTDTELTGIADAIRMKGETSAPLTFPNGFTSAINAIPTGVTPSGTYSITSNGIYDIISYASVDVNVSGGGGDADVAMIERTISTIDNSTATSVGSYAFTYCRNLTTVRFTNALILGDCAFQSCGSLNTISFPNVTSLRYSVFAIDDHLISADFPNVTYIGNNAFYGCKSLETASFPNAETISNTAFSSCYALFSANFPKVSIVGNGAFGQCSSLSVLSFPECTSIYSQAFRSCYRLISLYLLGSTVAVLGNSSTCFSSTPIGGYTYSAGQLGSIFVPSSLYSAYRSANNWSNYSSRFVSV